MCVEGRVLGDAGKHEQTICLEKLVKVWMSAVCSACRKQLQAFALAKWQATLKRCSFCSRQALFGRLSANARTLRDPADVRCLAHS